MAPQLALILVSIFVIFILKIESRESKDVSKAVWILMIWLLYSGSKSIGTWLNMGGTMEAGSPADRIFLIGLAVFGVTILIKRNFDLTNHLKNNSLLILIILYMLISVSWSNIPGISFRRWVREVIALVIIFLVASEKNPVQAISTAFRRAIYIYLPFSILVINYFPYYGRDYGRWSGELMWIGLADQKNGLAEFCIYAALFLIWSNWEKLSKWKSLESKLPVYIDIFMLLLSIYLLMGPDRTLKYSVTSTISLLVGLAIMIFLSINMNKGVSINRNLVIFFMILIIFIGAMMPFTRITPAEKVASAFGRDDTLTGRTQIWATLVPYANKRMFLGYGQGGFWTTSMRELTSSHGHNGYLDTILDLGIVGLTLISIMFIYLGIKFVNLQNSYPRLAILLVCLLYMALVHSMAESGLSTLSGFPNSLIILFLEIPGTEETNSSLISEQT